MGLESSATVTRARQLPGGRVGAVAAASACAGRWGNLPHRAPPREKKLVPREKSNFQVVCAQRATGPLHRPPCATLHLVGPQAPRGGSAVLKSQGPSRLGGPTPLPLMGACMGNMADDLYPTSGTQPTNGSAVPATLDAALDELLPRPALEPADDLETGPVSEYTRDAVARMVLRGLPVTQIAQIVGRKPENLKRLLKKPDMLARIEEIREVVFRNDVTWWYELRNKTSMSLDAIDAGLASNDIRIRLETAKWVYEKTNPEPTKKHEVDMVVSGRQHIEVDVGDLTPVMERLGRDVGLLLAAAKQDPNPLDRVKLGGESLPQAQANGDRSLT